MGTADTATVINQAMEDPIPKMQEVAPTTVDLLLGIEGNPRVAIVREMNGSDEEFLASIEAKTALSYSEYISTLLKRTVVSVGELEIKKTPDVIDELIIADRDILFLAVVKATYGKLRTFNVSCPHCQVKSDLTIDIDEDFPLQGTSEDAETPVEVTLRSGEKVVLRLPNGADTKIATKKGKTIPEQNTIMIARCAQVNIPNKEKWARELPLGDRNALRDALLGVEIGPKAGEVNDPCPSCGETISLALDWVSLLFG